MADETIDFAQRFNLGETTNTAPPKVVRPLPEPAPPEAEPGGEELELLPLPGDRYQAHSRPTTKPPMTLHCFKGTLARGFAWHNFDSIDLEPSDTPGGAPVLVLRFAGREWMDVRIEGRNLGRLHAYLGQGRISWIRECPAGKETFLGTGEVVITRITLTPAEC